VKFTTLTAGGMALFLLALVAGLAVFYTYIYRQEARHAHGLSGWKQWALRTLRLAVAALALLAIARPALTMTRTKRGCPWWR